jgi:glycine C-acetyltransferase
VIPKGEIILRVIPTAAHTMEDVEYTINTFKAVRAKFEAGEYIKPIPQMADPDFKVR